MDPMANTNDHRDPPLDLSHHLSRTTVARQASSMKLFYKYFARKSAIRRHIYQLSDNRSPRHWSTRRWTAQQLLLPLRHSRSQSRSPRSLGTNPQPTRRSPILITGRFVFAVERSQQQEREGQDREQPSQPTSRRSRSPPYPQPTQPSQED